jgi:ABC-2 type transport system permease protein
MEQLISTPVKPAELIIGKLIPYFTIGFTDLVLAITAGVFWFGVPMQGNVLLLLALSCIFIFGGVCFGILISINAGGSQAIASQMALISSFLPAFLLSGFIFEIANMPGPLQVVTYIIPARYFVTISKAIFLKGSPFSMLMIETLLLVVFAAVVFTAAVKRFRKRIG